MTRLLIALCFLSFISCSPEKAYETASTSSDSKPGQEARSEKAIAELADAAKVMVQGAYTLTPFTKSPAFKDAEIKSYSYKDGKFDFKLANGAYQLGAQTPDAESKMCANSGKGQHIHLIIDNEPYAAKYENSFAYDLADGEHYLLAFLSRSYHESIKTDKAYVAEKIVVKNKSIVSREKITEPMLFYSRPKGTYVGAKEIQKIMLDYYVINTEIGKDHFVRMTINNREKMILKTWQPYYLEGLGIGSNSISLTLLDKDLRRLDIPTLPVTREFTLKNDPTE